MKKLQHLQKFIVPVLALSVGLASGLFYGKTQLRKAEGVCQERIRESDRKAAYIQKKATQEKAEAEASLDQEYQESVRQISDLKQEKKNLAGQAIKLKEQIQLLELKVREADEIHARVKKLESRIKEADEASVKQRKELQEAVRKGKGLAQELRKMTAGKQSVQAELAKTAKSLGACETSNAKLSGIAEELLEKYRNKGFAAVLAQKEPLTQIRKVELEELTQQYREAIREQKINQKKCEGETCY